LKIIPKSIEVKTVTYESEDDGRTWEYGLTITDAESEGEADGGKGMQIYWKKTPFTMYCTAR